MFFSLFTHFAKIFVRPGALSLGVKRTGREGDHSPSSSADYKEYVELYIYSPIRLHGVVLSQKKAHGHLYLYLYHL